MTVDIVVVSHRVSGTMQDAGIAVVGWDTPREVRRLHRRVEAQVLCRVVNAPGAVEPHASKVERHVNLVTGIGVVAIDPNLVVGRVDALHPNLVDEHIGLDFIIVAAVNHHLALRVEITHRALCLRQGEIAHRVCLCCECEEQYNC